MRSLITAVLFCATAHAQENILVLIADDVGVDRVGVYGEHPDPGRTPNIDRLAERGILFRNAWSNPNCSPTRAALLTGRHPFRTGIGSPLGLLGIGLSIEENTIPKMLGPEWASIALGKWHLGSNNQGPLHALQCGFDIHSGSVNNIGNYSLWQKSVNGESSVTDTYATTDTTNDAIRVIRGAGEPWFLWVAFNAPHKPFHAPPDHLHDFDLSGDPEASPVQHYKAMMQALDHEIGRLLNEVDFERTTVIFLGDNGTVGAAVSPPHDPTKAKNTVFEGGVNVPLIVAGPRVTRGNQECTALVQTTDLFATVAEVAGRANTAVDSVSFLPYLAQPGRPTIRPTVFAEQFWLNGFGPYIIHRRAIRDLRYKLMVSPLTGIEKLYDLVADPFETSDLLESPLTDQQAQHLERLRQSMTDILAS